MRDTVENLLASSIAAIPLPGRRPEPTTANDAVSFVGFASSSTSQDFDYHIFAPFV